MHNIWDLYLKVFCNSTRNRPIYRRGIYSILISGNGSQLSIIVSLPNNKIILILLLQLHFIFYTFIYLSKRMLCDHWLDHGPIGALLSCSCGQWELSSYYLKQFTLHHYVFTGPKLVWRRICDGLFKNNLLWHFLDLNCKFQNLYSLILIDLVLRSVVMVICVV